MKETTRLKKKLSKFKYYKRNVKFRKKVKLWFGCQICGYKDNPCALQFDHINPSEKKTNISRMDNHSMKSLKEEMRKCRVLCANCHAVHNEVQRLQQKEESINGKKILQSSVTI